ncbi:Uncharacterized protein TCM_000901 isoform 1 [Theobroma cacao]|uniref:Uncharacterized protein isoform 1 n=1 Tax=Theobroma cacao TaxID=3641 RepID=A0A061DIV1_THECC|nr:Uncharacterized protein TCM_000901 isoform 1 [Theobroma cacao]EOX91832.1 Uncharacterized protein TCM_000901 isoform 1 [Theobroma cacao]
MTILMTLNENIGCLSFQSKRAVFPFAYGEEIVHELEMIRHYDVMLPKKKLIFYHFHRHSDYFLLNYDHLKMVSIAQFKGLSILNNFVDILNPF